MVWPRYSLLIAQGVCYLTLCEASFPKKMAFEYLEDLRKKFYDQYGEAVPTVTRPYSFTEFGKTEVEHLLSHRDMALITFSKKNEHFYCILHVVPGTRIQKEKKPAVSSTLRRTLANINKELDDIQKIMAENIDEVLQRDSLCGKCSRRW